ncbi:hypothetical protein HHL19_18660 [Streptomyces sp. R302]|uniref:hypothetical protein n=1 Tax=unclassified Streptomyces TaxID=2593676 RepID=UPI00145E8821|nr:MULTISPECIES: hypothetical protein [unclassified Streptomyces]NML54796.1 hypothetical protein [Streptomyces sp. R301]NML80635.1 hypothetical protein [Streptomyces sp. R302]
MSRRHPARAAWRTTAGLGERAVAVVRWARPGRALLLAMVLLMLASLSSLLLAAVATAAPEPTPSPSVPNRLVPSVDPANPLAPAPVLTPPADGTTLDESGQEAERKATAQKKEQERRAKEAWDKKVEDYLKNEASRGGVLSAFEVTDRNNIPVSAYRVYADTGDWNDWDLKIEHFLVEMMFLGNKWLVSFACFLITWALSFSLAGLLLKPALTVSTSLYGGVIVQLGLPTLFLTFAMVVASWHLLFGNRARGWGEMAAALVISALALGALASPPQMLLSKDDGVVATVRDLAVETAALVLDKEAIDAGSTGRTTAAGAWEKTGQGATVGQRVRNSPASIARPITDALVDAFVARPAMMLSYGRTFSDPQGGGGPKCGTLFRESRISQAVFDKEIDEILASGEKKVGEIPYIGGTLQDIAETTTQSTDTVIREKLAAKGPLKTFENQCVKDGAASAKKASMEKVGGAFFMVIAAFLTCIFMITLTAGFLFAQLQIAIEAMIAKVGLAVGVLPGPGRGWLWDRATAIARALALMLVSVASVAVFIVVVNAVLNASDRDLPGGITIRFVMLDCVVLGAFIYRKRLAHATRGLAARARARVGASVVGGTAAPALSSPKRRGMGGALALGGLALGAAALTGGAGAVVGLGRAGAARTATSLGGMALRGTGRAVAGTARLAGRTAVGSARIAAKTTRFGLQATIGLPVYGPRAARRVGAAATALPGRLASARAAAGARARRAVQAVHQSTVAPAANLVGEGVHNVRSLGRIVTGRGGLGLYRAPNRPGPFPPPPPPPRRRPVPPRPAHPPTPTPAPAPAPVRRGRPAPPIAQPPAGPNQARLRQRLHRVQAQQTPAAAPPQPPTPQPPQAAPVQPAPAAAVQPAPAPQPSPAPPRARRAARPAPPLNPASPRRPRRP